MEREIVQLVRAMGGQGDEVLLRRLGRLAWQQLERALRPGVTAEDCGEAFPVAAAWLVLDALDRSRGMEGLESFSAGDLSVKLGTRSGGGGRADQVKSLMAPFTREEGFAFQGVRG